MVSVAKGEVKQYELYMKILLLNKPVAGVVGDNAKEQWIITQGTFLTSEFPFNMSPLYIFS